MKSVNIADLKNNLSSYLDEVEKGEQIVVRNRQRPVARIVRIEPLDMDDQERQLVLNGEMRLPDKEMSKRFWDRILTCKLPALSKGTSVEALVADRDE